MVNEFCERFSYYGMKGNFVSLSPTLLHSLSPHVCNNLSHMHLFPLSTLSAFIQLVLSFGEDFQKMPHRISPTNSYRPRTERPSGNQNTAYENISGKTLIIDIPFFISVPRVYGLYHCWEGEGRDIRSPMLSFGLA